MHTRLLTLTVALAVVASLALVGTLPAAAADGAPTISVSDADVDPDGTATVDLTISEAPNGLSGFTVNVSTDGAVEITDAAVDDVFGLGGATIADDGSEVGLTAVDINRDVGPTDDPVHLATLELRGVDPGDGTLEVTVNAIEDDEGNVFDTATGHGSVTVTGSSASASAGGDDDGLAVETGVLVGGLALLVVAGLVARYRS
ncbi:hypothetical protein [Natronobiforma cellulositropha]|uniref:hypothetical protein n=1 Tax=Natronobiforma cellulositropha TaxID=1679076 RepID=UPI0021D5A8C4|nr:hypothetical protein [Natronobiforma cellulositropha]